MPSVLLADDHRILVDGLTAPLDRHPDVEVVGVAKAVALAAEHRPDIALLDISMPRLNGLGAARQILKDTPSTQIVMLSMHADRAYVQQALRIGARGYLLKESAARELIRALAAVHAGELFFSESIRDQVVQDYVEIVRGTSNAVRSPLSPRERSVLQLLAEGRSTKEIADTLNVSAKTVETHRKQVMDKLDLHSVAALTRYAIRAGITRLD